MKHQKNLLPRMAVNNIRKNGSTYLPYIGVSVFAMFTYFVFDLILKNDVMNNLPKGAYAVIMVQIGFWLLGIIMVPFLYYTNSFLIKRRKKELGLYSILGLEKKHIGIMMFWESLIVYGIVLLAAVGLGLLFSRLIFLLLLNLIQMPVNVEFAISPKAVADTMVFYAFITGLNLFVNLIQVGRTNPVELMSDARRGEREPRYTWIWTILGLLSLGTGYYLAVTAQLDNMIFNNFFLAVFLVILGTYFLFTSGSITLLRMIKKRKKLFYHPAYFINVSGMLYRMKKNAASLSNICIFATMVIITLVCTLSVYLGMDSIIGFKYSRNVEIIFLGKDSVDRQSLKEQTYLLAKQYGVEAECWLDYACVETKGYLIGNEFKTEEDEKNPVGRSELKLLTLEEYNRMEGTAESLMPGELLLYSTGKNFSADKVFFEGKEFQVRKELESCIISKRAGNYYALSADYVIVAADEAVLEEIAGLLGTEAENSWNIICGFSLPLEGEQENAFSEAVRQYVSGQEGFAQYADHRRSMKEAEGMYGGLLFIGIFFGLIFLICLLIIMYYKQITEGFEDQKNFEIMQKVGLSDEEIRCTIKKQVRLIFLLPLAGALLHTAIGLRMALLLLGGIYFFETKLLLINGLIVCGAFSVVYILCYRRTSVTYYKIVKQL